MSASDQAESALHRSTPTFQAYREATCILRLLYAPEDNTPAAPIENKHRLYKGLYIAQDKLDSEFDRDTPITFEPDKYGVVMPNFDESIHLLEANNLVTVSESDDEFPVYTLTSDGISTAQELYEELSDGEQDLFGWIRTRHLSKPLGQILSFCYAQYGMATDLR